MADKTAYKALPDKTQAKFARIFMGPFLAHMARSGSLTDADLKNRQLLAKLISKKITPSIKSFKLYVSIHESFLEQASRHWKAGDKLIAIVLLAVALEHCLNHYVRGICEEKGLTNIEITNVVKGTNIESKLTWLNSLIGGKPFPAQMKSRIKKIFEIRNSIVHYKGAPSDVDADNGSHSAIANEIKLLGRFSVHRTFRSIDSFISKQLSAQQPWRWTATRAYYLLLDNFDPQKERSNQD